MFGMCDRVVEGWDLVREFGSVDWELVDIVHGDCFRVVNGLWVNDVLDWVEFGLLENEKYIMAVYVRKLN